MPDEELVLLEPELLLELDVEPELVLLLDVEPELEPELELDDELDVLSPPPPPPPPQAARMSAATTPTAAVRHRAHSCTLNIPTCEDASMPRFDTEYR